MAQLMNTPAVIVSNFKASATLAAKQWYIVKMASTSMEVVVGAAATDAIIGVVQNDPAAGEVANIGMGGILKVAAEASVSVGDYVTVSSTGRAKTTTTDGDIVLGSALTAGTTAGDLITVVASGPEHLYIA